MKSILSQSLENSFSYSEYRQLIQDLLAEGKSTGNTQSEALLQYSQLNETRMNRLEKTISVPAELKLAFENTPKKVTLLTLAEGWCGDAAQIVPVLHKIAETSEKIDLKMVLRDRNLELMELFLTNGSQSIPKVIILDTETQEVLNAWGPRPEPARKLIADYKDEHGVVDEPIKIELQKWYLKDKGLTTMKEILSSIN